MFNYIRSTSSDFFTKSYSLILYKNFAFKAYFRIFKFFLLLNRLYVSKGFFANGNLKLFFNKIVFLYLTNTVSRMLYVFKSVHIVAHIFNLIFNKKNLNFINNNKFYKIVSIICNVILKQNYYVILYLYTVFIVLFKRIFYLLGHITLLSASFFLMGCNSSLKYNVIQEPCLKYHLYYKNIYFKNQKNKINKNIVKIIKSKNIFIGFLQYKNVLKLYKKLRFFTTKKIITKFKKNKKVISKNNHFNYRAKQIKKNPILNLFSRFKCINFRKRTTALYVKTLRNCFNIKLKYLQDIKKIKEKKPLKKKIKIKKGKLKNKVINKKNK